MQSSTEFFTQGPNKHGQAAQANPSTAGNRQESWATPRAGKTTDENPETWAKRQERGEVATMPLTAQVKAWATPKASDPGHSGPNMRDSSGNYALPAQAVRESWATATVSTGAHRQADGSMTPKLDQQVKTWGTPTARDHKSGRGNSERDFKELTPMVERTQSGKLNPRWVETLMGLPVGWVMPSCSQPLTIAPTNSVFSETESCQPPPNELS